MTSKIKVYKEGKNKWRDNRYDYMSELNQRSGIRDFGKSVNSNYYYHLISEDNNYTISLMNNGYLMKPEVVFMNQKQGIGTA